MTCFTRIDRHYRPEDGAVGPWSPDLLQGSATGALMASAIEQAAAGGHVARLSFDLWRPIGRKALALDTRVLRDGRKARTLAASLSADGVELARVTAQILRRQDTVLPEAARAPDIAPAAGPEAGRPIPERVQRWSPFFRQVEVRVIAGDLMEQGPAAVWFRLNAPVVAGEAVTSLMQAVSAADLISGISSVVSIRDWTFVNADLTMTFDRAAVSDWILVEAEMVAQPDGTGQTRAWLSDHRGRFGQATQSVLIEPRRPNA
jgi:hypothetical protein